MNTATIGRWAARIRVAGRRSGDGSDSTEEDGTGHQVCYH